MSDWLTFLVLTGEGDMRLYHNIGTIKYSLPLKFCSYNQGKYLLFKICFHIISTGNPWGTGKPHFKVTYFVSQNLCCRKALIRGGKHGKNALGAVPSSEGPPGLSSLQGAVLDSPTFSSGNGIWNWCF